MAAFQRSVDLGYRYIETDTHCTADGVLVAFHDDRLDRVTDAEGVIGELSWAEVSQARIGGTEPIPKLADVLATWPDLRVNIEPKSDRAVAPLVRLIRQTLSLDRVCIGSFDNGRVKAARRALGADLCTSPGSAGIPKVLAHMVGLAIGRVHNGCLQIPSHWNGVPVVNGFVIDRAHAIGLQVHVWTINDEMEMRSLLGRGVDAIISDELVTLKRVLDDVS